KGIEADACFQYLECCCGLARKNQSRCVSIVDVIGVECEGALEFGDSGVVPALEKQDVSKLGASLRQTGVEVHRRLRQFNCAIDRGGTEIVTIEGFDISAEVSPGQHGNGARISSVDRQGLFEQAPCVIQRGFRASAQVQEIGFRAA